VENVQADMNNVITADASPVSWLSQFLLAWNPSTQILIYNLIYLIGWRWIRWVWEWFVFNSWCPSSPF